MRESVEKQLSLTQPPLPPLTAPTIQSVKEERKALGKEVRHRKGVAVIN